MILNPCQVGVTMKPRKKPGLGPSCGKYGQTNCDGCEQTEGETVSVLPGHGTSTA